MTKKDVPRESLLERIAIRLFIAVSLWLTWIGWGPVLVWAVIAIGALGVVLLITCSTKGRRPCAGTGKGRFAS